MTKKLVIRDLKELEAWNYENGYHWFAPKTRINKLLAQYELYKMIINIPGHIFELGVFKGTSLIRFATFRDALENDFSRKIVGFDVFGEFPREQLNIEDDLKWINRFEASSGNGLDDTEIMSVFNNKGFENIELIKGNIFDTIPKYINENPETKIAILHLDMDVKEPTDFALAELYERLVPGGLIILDDYNAVAGETISIDNFLNEKKLKIEKLSFYNVPAYIKKPI